MPVAVMARLEMALWVVLLAVIALALGRLAWAQETTWTVILTSTGAALDPQTDVRRMVWTADGEPMDGGTVFDPPWEREGSWPGGTEIGAEVLRDSDATWVLATPAVVGAEEPVTAEPAPSACAEVTECAAGKPVLAHLPTHHLEAEPASGPVVRYRAYEVGGGVLWSADTPRWRLPIGQSTRRCYAVAAVDADGNEGPCSAPSREIVTGCWPDSNCDGGVTAHDFHDGFKPVFLGAEELGPQP